jgi:hypothetical protein
VNCACRITIISLAMLEGDICAPGFQYKEVVSIHGTNSGVVLVPKVRSNARGAS